MCGGVAMGGVDIDECEESGDDPPSEIVFIPPEDDEWGSCKREGVLR